MQGSTTDSTP